MGIFVGIGNYIGRVRQIGLTQLQVGLDIMELIQ